MIFVIFLSSYRLHVSSEVDPQNREVRNISNVVEEGEHGGHGAFSYIRTVQQRHIQLRIDNMNDKTNTVDATAENITHSLTCTSINTDT